MSVGQKGTKSSDFVLKKKLGMFFFFFLFCSLYKVSILLLTSKKSRISQEIRYSSIIRSSIISNLLV